jgi:hypothetical protein
MSSLASWYLFGLSLSSENTFHDLVNDHKTDSEVELVDILNDMGSRTKNENLVRASLIV